MSVLPDPTRADPTCRTGTETHTKAGTVTDTTMHGPGVVWDDAARQASFERWLATISTSFALDPHTLSLANADASFRRYFRIRTTGASATASYIIMDAPPARENSAPFVAVARLMKEAGVLAPDVLAWDEPGGFMLLSDLGHVTMMSQVQAQPAAACELLYRRATATLVRWQQASRAAVLPPYDEALLRRELGLFPEWYLGQHRGLQLSPADAQTLEDVFGTLVAHNLRAAPVYVHRDFMPRNLMVCDDTLGVLDFQDAVYGPVTYDIASLMRDAFLTWDEEFVLDITVRYWEQARRAGLPVDPDFGEFYRGVEWMGLQRHLKVAGIFARLTLRDGKPRYLADTPRFIDYIRATTGRYRELKPLRHLIDRLEGTETPEGLAFGRV